MNTAPVAFQGFEVSYICNPNGNNPVHLGQIDLQIDPAYDNHLTYEWNNGATTQDISNLSSGLYLVTITSTDGCVIGPVGAIIDNFTISEAITTDCSDNDQSSISLTTTGATGGPVTYEWVS